MTDAKEEANGIGLVIDFIAKIVLGIATLLIELHPVLLTPA